MFKPVLLPASCHRGPECVPRVHGLTLVIMGSDLTQSFYMAVENDSLIWWNFKLSFWLQISSGF